MFKILLILIAKVILLGKPAKWKLIEIGIFGTIYFNTRIDKDTPWDAQFDILVNCTIDDDVVLKIPSPEYLSHYIDPDHYILTPHPEIVFTGKLPTWNTIHRPFVEHRSAEPLRFKINKIKKLKTIDSGLKYPAYVAIITIHDERFRASCIVKTIGIVGCQVHSLSYWKTHFSLHDAIRSVYSEEHARNYYNLNRDRLLNQATRFEFQHIGKYRKPAPRNFS